MLEAGVHFGHQVRRWNPKMKPYIYGKKNGIYIINLQTSIELFKTALSFVTDVVAEGKEALIVGTKRQAQSIITEVAEDMNMHYVNKRWLGGLLTNFEMVKKSIEKLLDLDEMRQDGRWDVKSKREQSKLEKIYKKLHKNLWGIRNIKQPPGVLIVIDSIFENIAVEEARKLNIPIVAIVDTNADPDDIDYPIPGNDDAIRSIRLFATKFGEAVQEGLERRETDALERVAKEEAAATAESESEDAAPAEETVTEAVETPVTEEKAVEEEVVPEAKEETPQPEPVKKIDPEPVKEEAKEAETVEKTEKPKAKKAAVKEEKEAEEKTEKTPKKETKTEKAPPKPKAETKKAEPKEKKAAKKTAEKSETKKVTKKKEAEPKKDSENKEEES